MQNLPATREMYQAFERRDAAYDGIFYTAVRTTGIFCRPTCPARKPLPQNVEFFATAGEAVVAGYRPCKRCRPLEPAHSTPAWLAPLIDEIEADPVRRIRDSDLKLRGLEPVRVRRWFQSHYGLTFQAWQRARRLGLALGHLREEGDLADAAFAHGYESLSGFRDAFARVFGEPPGRAARGAAAIAVTRLPSPLGTLVAAAGDQGVCLLEFADRRMLETQVKRVQKFTGLPLVPGSHPLLEQLRAELEEWFAGRRRQFSVPLHIAGTDFQRAVWQGLATIPYAARESYESLARRIGRPGARRAVGRANGDNRLAILLPCHRVVGADGELRGYGGGLWRKRWLLAHEEQVADGGSVSLRSEHGPAIA
ncbi:MAG: methylated-DNA--[protein]-cysteine S-methyltransferase [Gammaproteobacteria bacterium]|jgi:AraC family transcriptional regulator of adaptative response/methylated-DNA-[protein]-cysteine methyltransferase|nr:methylated-DNA--[protein]-cysteine S-methyltransferase [Gammaproteobacteria bacterium]